MRIDVSLLLLATPITPPRPIGADGLFPLVAGVLDRPLGGGVFERPPGPGCCVGFAVLAPGVPVVAPARRRSKSPPVIGSLYFFRR